MEEQDMSGSSLPFLPLATNWMASNASGLLGDQMANQDYIMNTGSTSGIQPEPFGIPQWMQGQITPQNYVEFLAESGYPEIQKQMFYDVSAQVHGSGLPAYPSQLEEYPRLHSEGNLISGHTALEHQVGVQKQNWNEECNYAYQSYPVPRNAPPKYSPESRRKRSKEKTYAADRNRRMKISHWHESLEELVPCPKEVRKEDFLDHVIDHIKILQYQVKDLCRSRLGGEPTSNSLMLLEGHGQYLVQEQMLNQSLEEMMGKLVNDHPSEAAKLLESRGLAVRPMTIAEGLLEPVEMFNMQEKRLTSNPQVINK